MKAITLFALFLFACGGIVGTEPSDDIHAEPVLAPTSAPAVVTPGGPMATPAASTPEHVSGTRLKARRQLATDGTRSFAGWYDSERHENCTIRKANDGSTRCLPDMVPTTLFSDATCRNLRNVAEITCGKEIPKYLALESGGGCFGNLIYAATTYTGPVFEAAADGSCVPHLHDSDNSTFVQASSPVVTDSFVEAKESVDP